MRSYSILAGILALMPVSSWAQFGPGMLAGDQTQLAEGERLIAADVDGDGWNDLAMQVGGTILWLRNADGAGSFDAAATLFSSDTIYHFDLADFDGDLDLDLVVVHGSVTAVVWVENQGDGLFGDVHHISALDSPAELGTLLCHDIDMNGTIDVLVWENDFHFFRNDGGTFTEVVSGLSPPGGPIRNVLLAGDIDLDGDQDLLMANWSALLIAARNTDGTGTTWESDIISDNVNPPGVQHRAIRLHDVDGDGDLDVVSAMDWLQLARNPTIPHGWGEFATATDTPGGSSWGIGWSGQLGCGESVSLLWQNIPWDGPVFWSAYDGVLGAFAPPVALMDSIRCVQLLAADLNHDGANDIIIADRDSPHIWWFPNLIPSLGSTTLELAPFDTLCLLGDPYPLAHATPSGGTWIGEGVENNIFTPVDPGSVNLSYAVTDEATGCPLSGTQPISAFLEPVITLVSGILDECALDPLQFAASPSGGQWSGIVEADGSVDVSCAARPISGSMSYVMNAVNGGGCVASFETMNFPPCYPINLGPDRTLCANADTLVVSASQFSLFTGFDSIVYSDPTAWGYFYATEHALGQYELSVVGISQSGCPGYDTLVVTVVPPPAVSLTAPDAVDIDGGPVTFDDGTPEGGWHVIGGIASPTVDPISYNVGDYIVVIYFYTEPSTGCTGSDTAYVMVEQITSVSHASLNEDVRVAPNPVIIQCQVEFGKGSAHITLIDGVGRLARRWPAMASPASLDLSGIAPGSYLLAVDRGGRVARVRLTVQ